MSKFIILRRKPFTLLTLICAMVVFSQISCEKNVMDDMGNPSECKEDVSYQTDIKPILESKCIQCHNGSVHPLDYRIYEVIKSVAPKAKSLTASRIMPKQGSLTDEQIKLIGCWVDAGAPNN